MKRSELRPGERSLERGSTFATSRSELARGKPLEQKSRRRDSRSISPASKAQRAWVASAVTCTGCGRERTEWLALDPAHLWPRGLGGCDDELCVVPLCRTFDGSGCHRLYDSGGLDLLPKLEPHYRRELAHAVLHGGLAAVYARVTGQRRLEAA